MIHWWRVLYAGYLVFSSGCVTSFNVCSYCGQYPLDRFVISMLNVFITFVTVTCHNRSPVFKLLHILIRPKLSICWFTFIQARSHAYAFDIIKYCLNCVCLLLVGQDFLFSFLYIHMYYNEWQSHSFRWVSTLGLYKNITLFKNRDMCEYETGFFFPSVFKRVAA